MHAGQNIEKFIPSQSSLITGGYSISVQFPLHLVNKNYPIRQETFPDKLKAVRIEAGLTQEAFARRVEVTEDTIRNWEKGRAVPSN